MIGRYLTIVLALATARAFCSDFMSWPFYNHLTTFTNISAFKEIHSTTNLPPELRKKIAGQMKLAEPGGPLVHGGARLTWAATDGTNYVVHYEVYDDYWNWPDSPYCTTDYWVTAEMQGMGSTNFIFCNGSCSGRLKDYKEFIDREIQPQPRWAWGFEWLNDTLKQ